jgi:hypothetical protein
MSAERRTHLLKQPALRRRLRCGVPLFQPAGQRGSWHR